MDQLLKCIKISVLVSVLIAVMLFALLFGVALIASYPWSVILAAPLLGVVYGVCGYCFVWVLDQWSPYT